jgi:hypothetical protein
MKRYEDRERRSGRRNEVEGKIEEVSSCVKIVPNPIRMQVGRFAIKILEKYAYYSYIYEKRLPEGVEKFGLVGKCELTKISSIISFLKKA